MSTSHGNSGSVSQSVAENLCLSLDTRQVPNFRKVAIINLIRGLEAWTKIYLKYKLEGLQGPNKQETKT